MKSKIEEKLNKILSDKFIVKYEPTTFYGKTYSLKVDFAIKNNYGDICYLEYSGMNFFKKYCKIIDVAKYNENFYVIFDDEKLESELEVLYSFKSNFSELTISKTLKRIEKFNNIIDQILND